MRSEDRYAPMPADINEAESLCPFQKKNGAKNYK